MRATTAVVRAMAALLACAACGGVSVPDERYYRLALPPRPAVDGLQPLGGTLVLDRVGVAPHLRGDGLQVANGPVGLQPYRFHRWVAPVEEVVHDALLTGFERAGVFGAVVAAVDARAADWSLRARVLELQQTALDGRWVARAVLRLTLTEVRSGRVVVDGEFGGDVPVDGDLPEDVVRGLSRGVGMALDQLIGAAAVGDSGPRE